VDWARTAYTGSWRLFADAPTVETQGRYYFTPEGTPFVKGEHHFQSGRWFPTNFDIDTGLGPVLTTPEKYYNGRQPAVLPKAEILGSTACLAAGGLISNAIEAEGIFDGFPTSCFAPQTPIDRRWALVSTGDACQLNFFYARILEWMYANQQILIAQAFEQLIGPDVIVTWRAGNAFFPDVVVAQVEGFSVVVVDGTQTYQQLAMQAFAAITGPTNIGIFSCSLAWYAASSWVINVAIAAGVDFAKPVMLVGHSYGGAAVTTAVARLRAWDKTRTLASLTFGSPKVGDSRMNFLLGGAPAWNVLNAEDIVGVLPPDFTTTYPISVALALPSLLRWNLWDQLPNRFTQGLGGAIKPNNYPILDYPTLLELTQKILLGQPFDTIIFHSPAAYAEKIFERCPNAGWPIEPDLWAFLLGNPPPPIGGVGLGGNLDALGGVGLGGGEVALGGVGLGGGEVALGGVGLGGGEVALGGVGLGGGGDAEGGVGLGGGGVDAEGGVGLGGGGDAEGGVGVGGGEVALGGVQLGGGGDAEGGVGLGGAGDAEGGVGLGGGTPTVNCLFCVGTLLPAIMRATLSYPAIPEIDGIVVDVPLLFGPGTSCSWSISHPIAGLGDLEITLTLQESLFPIAYYRIVLFTISEGNWDTNITGSTDYVCDPWAFAASTTFYHDGTPEDSIGVSFEIP